MALSAKATQIISEISAPETKLGDLKKRAREIKKDHELATELWASGAHFPRLLAVLILDKNQLDQNAIERLASDMLKHPDAERDQLADWLLANQLRKDKTRLGLLESWQDHPNPMLRRLFWYHQARLRWTGQAPPDNTEALLTSLEKDMGFEEPVVQWAMNYCAGQIGVHQQEFRSRCIKLGEDLRLYEDEKVARNCTPSYLPEFIRIEVAKRAS